MKLSIFNLPQLPFIHGSGKSRISFVRRCRSYTALASAVIIHSVLKPALGVLCLCLSACHTATTALVHTDSLSSVSQTRQEQVCMDSWTNIANALSLQFDSLVMTIEPQTIRCQGSAEMSGMDTLPNTGQRITIRAARAIVSKNETLARHDSLRVMFSDSIRTAASFHTKKQSTDEVRAVAQPLDITLVIISIAALAGTAICIWFRNRRSDK